MATWAGFKAGVGTVADWVKDTTVKYVGGKTITAVVAGAAILGGNYAYTRGSALFIKGMKFEDRNGDGAYDIVVDMRWPFRDTVYVQQLDAQKRGAGKFDPLWDKSEQDIEKILEEPMTPEASTQKK